LVGAITMIMSNGSALRKMRTSMSCAVADRGIHCTHLDRVRVRVRVRVRDRVRVRVRLRARVGVGVGLMA
jgi:hypothetical protein